MSICTTYKTDYFYLQNRTLDDPFLNEGLLQFFYGMFAISYLTLTPLREVFAT